MIAEGGHGSRSGWAKGRERANASQDPNAPCQQQVPGQVSRPQVGCWCLFGGDPVCAPWVPVTSPWFACNRCCLLMKPERSGGLTPEVHLREIKNHGSKRILKVSNWFAKVLVGDRGRRSLLPAHNGFPSWLPYELWKLGKQKSFLYNDSEKSNPAL